MRRTWMRGLGLLIWCLFFASLFSVAQAEEVVRIGGSGTSLGTFKLLGAAFERNHPGIRVQVFPSLGSAGGIMALSKGALDLALSSRPLASEERRAGLSAMEYARTPFVFIAHRNVGKNNMTVRELEDVYLGTTNFWPDGGPIRLVLRPEADTATQMVRSISRDTDRALTSARNHAHIVAITDQECASTVANLAGAFGTSNLTQIVAEGIPVKVLGFQGVAPSTKTLSDGSYPLFTPLYLVSKASTPRAAQQFVKFITSSEGRSILAKNGNLVTGRPSHDK